MRKISVLGIKKIIGPRPLEGGGAPVPPPHGSASASPVVKHTTTVIIEIKNCTRNKMTQARLVLHFCILRVFTDIAIIIGRWQIPSF